jgi:hypothetical protein
VSTRNKSSSDPSALPSAQERYEADQNPNNLEQVIERTSTRYMVDLRALSKELGRRIGATERDQESSDAPQDDQARLQDTLPTVAADAVVSDSAAPVSQSSEVPIPTSSEALRTPIDDVCNHLAQLQPPQPTLPETIAPTRKGTGEPIRYRIVLLFAISSITVLLVVGVIWTGSTHSPGRASKVTPVPTPEALSPGAVVSSSAAGEQTTALSTPASPTLAASERSPAATTALSAEASPVTALLQRVTEAESGLRMGELEATVDYSKGSHSSARVRFDLGDAEHAPRLHIVTTYQSANGSQTSERITIGDQSWQRQPDGLWVSATEEEGAWGQVQIFLPYVAEVSNVEIKSREPTVLHWHDVGRDAEVTLRVDPASGVPRELRQVEHVTGTVLTIVYNRWNTTVEIVPPVES